MDAAEPIQIETPKPNPKIDYIEEIMIKNEKENYKMHLGIQENCLLIKIEPEKQKNIYYYQNCYTINELQNISLVFSMYKIVKEIIAFLKDLEYKVEEKDENLVLKFNVFMPNGKNKLIEMEFKKILHDTNHIINFLLENIKIMETNIKSLEENYKIEKAKNEYETKNLKENYIKEKEKYESEIKHLKENISINQREISNLKEYNIIYKNENKKLWEEINKLKEYHIKINQKEKQNIFLDSKIIESKDKINFIFDYIKQNDNSFKFNNIKLLFRGSRDGERTKTCHELCDNKQNVLIIMKSETGYIFGGYSKIGFKTNNNKAYEIDNNCFLFSLNLKKIYPVINNQKIICNLINKYGLCFDLSLAFFDNFMHVNENVIYSKIKRKFNGINNEYEMNGGRDKFQCKELEVFQLL